MAYYALKKDVFDISKVTVVGSPTITSDGVASGFDSANANNIQIPTAIISQIATANTWKVEVGGTIQESGSTYANVRSDNNQRYDLIHLNRYANGFMFVCCLDENGATVSKNIHITFSNDYNNKAYKATLEFTGTKYIATVQFGDGEVLTNSLDSTYKIKFFNYGDNFELGYKCINGSINLKDFKIYVDGQLVFQPVKPTYSLERRKEGYDPSKFTVVGTPNITEYGVASGFSSKSSGTENYLTLPTVFNPQDKSWKIIIKATIGEWVSGSPYKSLLGTSIQGRDTQGVALALGTGNSIACWLSSTGTGWNIGTIRKYFPDIIGNTYYFKIEFTGAKYELSYSENKTNWNILGSIESSTPIYVSSQPLAIGDNKYNNAASTCWTGSIDLPSISITVDGKEVFTGAKEVYYAMEK